MSTAAQKAVAAAMGVLMFLALSIASGLGARVREPSDVGLAVGALVVTVTVGVVSAVLLRYAPRAARLVFAAAVAACIAVGLVIGDPVAAIPSPWIIAVPDVFTRGGWSMASWLLLGASATWALVRTPEPVPVEE